MICDQINTLSRLFKVSYSMSRLDRVPRVPTLHISETLCALTFITLSCKSTIIIAVVLEFCALRRSLVGGETREIGHGRVMPAVRNQTTRPAISLWSLCSHYAISMATDSFPDSLPTTRTQKAKSCPLFIFSIHSAPMPNTRYRHTRQTSFFSRLYPLPCGVCACTHTGDPMHQEKWSTSHA